MELKIITGLPAYVPEPVPLENAGLTRFLDSELNRISDALKPLLDTFDQSLQAGMIHPTAPLTIGTTQTKLTNYEQVLSGNSTDYTGVTIDQVAGEFIFTSSPTLTALVDVEASVICNVSGLPHNQSVSLFISDGTDYYPLDSVWIGSAQQDILSLSGSSFIAVNAAATLYITMTCEIAGTITHYSGEFRIKVEQID